MATALDLHVMSTARLRKLPSGKWIGVVRVQTPRGPVMLAATCHEDVIRAALQSSMAQALMRLQQARAQGAVSGSIFSSVFNRVKKIGKGIGQTVSNLARLRIKKALQAAARTAMAAAPIAAIAVPGAAAALAVTPARLASAQRFLSAARRGAPKARMAVQRITAKARAGDPRARQIALLLTQAMKLMQQQPAAAGSLLGQHGRYVIAAGGQQVFIPAAAGGPGMDYVLDQLRPRLGYRKDVAGVLTRRKAYRSGLAAITRQ